MEKPLKLFVGGGDGLDLAAPVIEERLKTMKENAALSKSTAISE